MNDQSTGELVRRAGRGDEDAWHGLVERYSRLLCSIAYSYGLSGADADDVMQTTWLRLVERLNQLRDPARAGTWLAVTARHESLATLRRLGRERPLPGHVPSVTGPHHVVFGQDLAASIGAALETIPPRCRRLLELFVASPRLSYAEISTALEIPIGSVGPTRARCLTHLRRQLNGAA
ncbi:sigma-70 family RNA polymerase sigma factor [Actinomadura sp. DC4]|uniref:RNA polymerase sigma factor n=1 Tax=Actinomadura sp. DC4 TaxID=3055069 RepID=UPI0025AF0DD4|nr:sigma-70 family RNA polymerase sigma factor [Actinomadura sp. DC4]MDN3359367.1 sigma-70 family RNA polymerase sigma factor [Actinomadura sp. DC4]